MRLQALLFAFFLAACSTHPTTPSETSCPDEDQDGSCRSGADADCDDHDPQVYPGAEELCNLKDDDCDGLLDEGFFVITGYADRDGDGYGDEALPLEGCADAENFSTTRGDCNDGVPSTYPGAADSPDDGIDSDCGGTPNTDPHVGFGEWSLSSIQEALEAAGSGQTVWVGSGWYHEWDLSMMGKAIALRSTAGASETKIDGELSGTVFYFRSGEGSDSLLDGFTIHRGQAGKNCDAGEHCTYSGGGIFIDSSSPTLRNIVLSENQATNGAGLYVYGSSPDLDQLSLTTVTLTGNVASSNGGGIYLYGSSSSMDQPSLTGVTLTGNSASSSGGGMYLYDASPALTDIHLSENSASDGGGMSLINSSPTLNLLTFEGNSASEEGGGLYGDNSSPSLSESTLLENSATEGGGMYLSNSSSSLAQILFVGNNASSRGGGIYLTGSSPTMSGVTLSGNAAGAGGGMYLVGSDPTLTRVVLSGSWAENGGGMYLKSSSPSLTNVGLVGNTASYDGGAMYLTGSSPTLIHGTLSGNIANDKGGGIFLDDSSPTLINVILAYNSGLNLWQSSGSPTITYCDLYNLFGVSHNLDSLDATNLEVDPLFIGYTNNEDPTDGIYGLRADSPLIDAGRPDLDSDGIPWESDADDRDPDGTRTDIGAFGGPDADWSIYDDLDEDGLLDVWEGSHELNTSVDDSLADPDGDGSNNLQEFEAGTDPQAADSDGDGYSDGAELKAGSDALNFCAQPGVEGLVALRVPEDYPTIQEAVDAVQSACRIEVAAGTWLEQIQFADKEIELVGVGGAEDTILDGKGQAGTVIDARQANISLNGFTLIRGNGDLGGGLLLQFAKGTLESLLIERNYAYESGGGIYLYVSSPSLSDVTLSVNSADENGGGIYMFQSSPSLTDVTLNGNIAYSSGGGMYLADSSPSLTRLSLVGNSADAYGGGMYLTDSSPSLTHVTLNANVAAKKGGGICLSTSSPTLAQVTLAGNSASDLAGGMYLSASSPRLTNVILAYNSKADLWQDSSSQPTLSYCDLYAPAGSSHNLDALDASNIEVDPQFVTFTNNGDPSDDELTLRPGSPLIDAGQPDLDGDGATWEADPDDRDPDGTRSDMGVYGGPNADWSGYEDLDADGLYDAWEELHALDTNIDDSGEDADGDGATNLEELENQTDPQVSDSDGDGYSDGAEIEAGSDALNPCEQPGVEGLAALRVPEDYPTIQAAVNAVQSACRIEVAAGTWVGRVLIEGKRIELFGLGGADGTILDGDGQGSVVEATDADLLLEGFTVAGGDAREGGGVYLFRSIAELNSLIIKGNSADNAGGGIYLYESSAALVQSSLNENSSEGDGGGMYLYESSPTLTQVTLSGNSADDDGGGMYLYESSPTLTQVTLSENSSYGGGGIHLGSNSSPVLAEVTFIGNSATGEGGGIYSSSSPSLTHVTLSGNSASNGGGMYLASSSPELTHVTLNGNSASYGGGGMYLSSSSPSLTNVTLSGNSASNGGGMYLSSSSPSLTNVTLSGNSASNGGGMYLSSSSPSLINVLLAYNSGGNLLWISGSPTLSHCALFSPYGTSHNLPDLDATNLEVDPQFLSFTNNGDPYDDDFSLRFSSPLIDAGEPDLDGDGKSWESDSDDRDPDGSRSDIGTFGGPGADWSVYADEDEDGLNDVWELAHKLDPGRDDGSEDPDGDGSSNLEELEKQTDPQNADSDGDGYSDGEELAAGSDALNSCSQPGVGLLTLRVPEDYETIQAAIDAVQASCRIEVAAGTWEGPIRVNGKGIELVGQGEVSLDGSQGSVLDGMQEGSTLTATQAELLLEGFTVTGGNGGAGGGLKLMYSKGKLESLVLDGNVASNQGGGIYLYASSMSQRGITVSGNTATRGAGMYLFSSSSSLSQIIVNGNSASDEGGGMYLESSSPAVTGLAVSGNSASDEGGGMYLSESSPILRQVILNENMGGAMRLLSSSPSLIQMTVTGNEGGGLYLIDSSPILRNVILAYNAHLNLNLASGAPTLSYCDLYNPYGDSHNLEYLNATNLEVEPQFISFDNNDDPTDDILGLRLASPLVDAGHPDLDGDGITWESDPDDRDPDWSRSDIGVYGGPYADWSVYADQDEDGLFDLWEDAWGLDSSTDDSGADPDGDGASNSEESEYGTDPLAADSDGDGYADGAEIDSDSEPLDPCSQPGLEGLATLRVPEDYATIQDAVDATWSSCRIEVAAGTWVEQIYFHWKGIELVGLGGVEQTILDGDGQGSVIDAVDAYLHLEGFTLTGGYSWAGGGLHLWNSEASLESVIVDGNSAAWAGGIYGTISDLTLNQVSVTGNFAEFGGGGIYLDNSVSFLSQVTISGNHSDFYGGGLQLVDSFSTLSQVALIDNGGSYGGGGMYLDNSSPTLDHVAVVGNGADGIYLSESSPTVINSVIAYNSNSNVYHYVDEASDPTFLYSSIYPADESKFVNLTLDSTNLTAEPGFWEEPDLDGKPGPWTATALHLELDSPLVNTGYPGSAYVDPDGSRADIGIYGGPDADGWDRDGDGWYDWFWPGGLLDAPPGFDPLEYDVYDWDAEVH